MIARSSFLCLMMILGFSSLLLAQVQPAKRTLRFRGEVIKVIDGDSLLVHIRDPKQFGNQERELDLAGIDAPESDQPFGKEAAAALSEMVLGKKISFHFVQKRTVKIIPTFSFFGPEWRQQVRTETSEAFVRIGSKSVNQEMLKSGFGWHTAPGFRKWENLARRKNSGLWQDPRPIHPLEWQKQQLEIATRKRSKKQMQDEANAFHPNGLNEIVKREEGKTVLYIYRPRQRARRMKIKDLQKFMQRSVGDTEYYAYRKRLAELSGKYDQVILADY